MNVLSLFDGKSSGYTAMELAGLPVTNYYSSEIDKYAIQVSNSIHPNQTRLGSITEWKGWGIDWSSIDLLIAGSPCQGFSAAGKKGGTKCIFDGEEIIVSDRETYLDMKTKGAEFLSQSHLFWEFILILDHIKSLNPDLKFMLENVKMSKSNMDLITNAIGVEPVFINSALLTAQNRQRYYWCNWSVPQPEDKGILLKDIIETNPDNTVFMSDKFINRNRESGCLRDNFDGKAKSLSAMKYVKNGRQGDYIYQKGRGNNPGGIRAINGKTPSLTSNAWEHNNHLISAKNKNPEISGDYLQFDPSGKGHKSQCNRVNLPESKHKSLSGTSGGNKHGVVVDKSEYTYRKLTPRECFRLQGTPEYYIDKILSCGVSNTQLYKVAGNGWTDPVIAHIFSHMDNEIGEVQLQLAI